MSVPFIPKLRLHHCQKPVATWCMLSIASSHCILTVTRDFYPKIWRRLEWKILVATWNWKRLWSGQVDWVDLTAPTLRSKFKLPSTAFRNVINQTKSTKSFKDILLHLVLKNFKNLFVLLLNTYLEMLHQSSSATSSQLLLSLKNTSVMSTSTF